MQSEHFIFNNINSIDMQQYSIHMQAGAVSSPFFGGQSIQESQVRGRLTPYHFGTQLKPIEFKIEISPLDKEWTPQMKNEIGKWLIHDTYKPFQTADDLDKFYYAIVTEMPDFQLYGNRGYIPITFRTNSAYAWSKVHAVEFDLSTNATTTTIQINNLSNINRKYRPKIQIQLMNGATGVTLKNTSNNNTEFKFTGLIANSTVSIDNENEYIESNNPLMNAFAQFNGNWLELAYGINQIVVTSKCKIWIESQFPILQ